MLLQCTSPRITWAHRYHLNLAHISFAFESHQLTDMRVSPTDLVHSMAASHLRLHCGSRAHHCGSVGAAGYRRCRRIIGVSIALLPTSVAATSAASSTLCAARRTYFWPLPESLVPEGETTSPFQSSPVPSVRERIVREYALSPLFGSRTPCCVLGFSGAAGDVLRRKADVRRFVAQTLGKGEAEVELGPLLQTKEMMLHRSGTDESPRVADGPGSRPDAKLRRVTRYARLPVQARTLLEVFLPGEEEQAELDSAEDAETDTTIRAHGFFLQEQLHRYMSEIVSAPSRSPNCSDIQGIGYEEMNGEMQPNSNAQGEMDDEADLRQGVAALYEECGVIYCEVPELDESDYVFDQLHGKEVGNDTATRVMDSWARRLRQQQPPLS